MFSFRPKCGVLRYRPLAGLVLQAGHRPTRSLPSEASRRNETSLETFDIEGVERHGRFGKVLWRYQPFSETRRGRADSWTACVPVGTRYLADPTRWEEEGSKKTTSFRICWEDVRCDNVCGAVNCHTVM